MSKARWETYADEIVGKDSDEMEKAVAEYASRRHEKSTAQNEEELARVYEYDSALLDLEDEVGRAIDNVEASMGSDGLPASIRHLTSKAQDCLDAFNRRDEVIQQG